LDAKPQAVWRQCVNSYIPRGSMDDTVEINRENLLRWGRANDVYLDYCEDLSLHEALGGVKLIEFETFVELLNDPECITRDEVYDLLCRTVEDAFLYYFDCEIQQLIKCLNVDSKTQEFQSWQEYINNFLYFYNKRDSISDSELYELTKMLVVKQYSYEPNIPHFEAKLTGNIVFGFTEIECVTYRFHPLDNQVVGHNTYFIYINLNKNKWLYNFRVPADEKELIEQIKQNVTRCSSADKKVWLEFVPR
jgi:hypothetical protein